MGEHDDGVHGALPVVRRVGDGAGQGLPATEVGARLESSTAPSCSPRPQAHKAASEATAVRQELAAARERAEQHKAAAAQAAAEAAAAREAEQRLQQQLAGEQRRSDKVGARTWAAMMRLWRVAVWTCMRGCCIPPAHCHGKPTTCKRGVVSCF